MFPPHSPSDRATGSPDAHAADGQSAVDAARVNGEERDDATAPSASDAEDAAGRRSAAKAQDANAPNAAKEHRAPGQEPPERQAVFAEVDLSAIRHNVRTLQDRAAPSELMAVVKADAYGHGATHVAPVLEDEGIRAFAVARPAEGIELREAGVRGRILVLGAPLPGDLPICLKHRLDVTVSSEEVARRVVNLAGGDEASATASGSHTARPERKARPERTLRVHVKVDTGMSRLGVSPDAVRPVFDRLRGAEHVEVAGVWTHFATADAPEQPLTGVQRERFAGLLRDLGDVPYHLENTGALMTGEGTSRTRTISDAIGRSPAYVRTGIALYGLAPSETLGQDPEFRLGLAPALSLKARVTHAHTIQPGTSVSYGALWTATRPTRIATLGVGYGDGYPRLGTGSATVQIGGEQRPVIGAICMDMCMVDLGAPDGDLARRVEVGDAATLFGPRGPTMYDVAAWAETIPYEICCGLSRRVPRIYRDA